MSVDITVILTAYKRDYFTQQLPAIFNQSIKPKKVYIWQNERNIDLDKYKNQYDINIIRSDENTKFFGRFAFANFIQTEYLAIFDDDIIPGSKWLENCLQLSKKNNCIVGQNGRNYKNNTFVNPNHYKENEVDFVGHCWFFKKEWLKYMWYFKPYTIENGEDIHFCLSAKYFGNIKSFVAQQVEKDKMGDITQDKLAVDQHASFKIKDHTKLRVEIYQYLLNNFTN